MAKTKEAVEPREVVIRHGVFWYHAMEPRVVAGEEIDALVERLAFHGQKVTLDRAVDIERGEQYGAFYSDDELKQLREQRGLPPASEDEEDEQPASLADDEDDDLVDYLLGTGKYDGKGKPSVDDVEAQAEGDPTLASRLLDAEDRASGGNPRATLVQKLQRIAAEGEG